MRYLTRSILTILFLSLCSVFFISLKHNPIDGAEIYFFNVGQGDATLIQNGDYQILIDGGPDESVLSRLGKVMPLEDKNIEMVILSHPHSDHISGLNSILDRYTISKVYSSGVIFSSDQYLSFLDKVKDKKIPFEIPELGYSIMPFKNSKIEFLWPGEQYQGKIASNENNSSLVVRFCSYSVCALLPGDQETDEQEKMLDYYAGIPKVFGSNIFKFPHHGSNNAANKHFTDVVGPEFVIYSVGEKNTYGHPSKEAQNIFSGTFTKIFRTDQGKTILFEISSQQLQQKYLEI